MSKYRCIVPIQDDMGSIDPFIVRQYPMTSKEEDALWHINNMRDHDGLRRLRRLPAGTKFERVYE